MNDQPDTASRREYTTAFLLLRLFLALRALMAGVEKFESGGIYSLANYAKNMERMAAGITGASFLPLWATRPFALSLGYLLIGLGLALLLGLKTRISLTLMGLVYIGLSFGLMAVQENEGVFWLAGYVMMTAAAVALSRHDRFAAWPDRKS
jgi:thiosulfate dehydrogenase (quinone) large subunit